MGKTFFAAAALAAAAIASPASAATIIACGGGSSCITGTTNVNLVGITGSQTGMGHIGSITGPEVFFSTTQAGGFDLIEGQATIRAAGGTTSLDNLFFSVATGFTAGEFNMNPFNDRGPQAFSVRIQLNDGTFEEFAVGNQRFGIQAGLGETINSVQITTPSGAFGSFTQLRLTPAVAAAVPEPGTWALMLLGFGGIGVSMRRRRRSTVLMQIA